MKKIIISILLVISMCFPLTGCFNNPTEGGGEKIPTFDELFPLLQNTPYAKVEVVKLHDAIYNGEGSSGEPSDRLFIMAECVVIEDYYEILEAGTEVTILIPLNFVNYTNNQSTQEGAFEKIKTVLTSSDYQLMNLWCAQNHFNYYHNGVRYSLSSLNNDLKMYVIEFDEYQMIPINNGVLDLEAVDSARKDLGCWNESDEYDVRNTEEFKDYFRNGMTEEEIRGSLKALNAHSVSF